MELNLSRPIIFFDIEATGLSITQSRIVELSLLKVYPNGKQTESMTCRYNPTIHIEEQASEVNGIYDEDVADCPMFKDKAQEIANFFKGCDVAGYNSNHFDVPLLVEEMLRAGITDFDLSNVKLVDVQTVFHKMEQRTLTAAYKFYCGKNLEDAHTAEADTMATYEVLKAQLDRYSELKNDINFLSEFTTQNKNVDFAGRFVYDDKGVEVFNFGKYRGKPVSQVLRTERGYYDWMMQGDFSQNTKQVLTKIRLKSAF